MRRAGFIKGMFDRFSDRNFFSTDECINDRAESDSGQIRKCTGGSDWNCIQGKYVYYLPSNGACQRCAAADGLQFWGRQPETFFGILATALFFFFREPIIHLFINDKDVIYYGVKMLVAYMLSGPFIGILFVNMNCMQSTGDALPATILSVLRQGLLLIPLLYLLNAVLGLNGVIYGQVLTDCVAIVLSMYIWGRKKRKLKSE